MTVASKYPSTCLGTCRIKDARVSAERINPGLISSCFELLIRVSLLREEGESTEGSVGDGNLAALGKMSSL